MKRGTIKAFREFLNAKHADKPLWRNYQFHQIKRGYGDYLYFQDRTMFDVCLHDALAGDPEYKGWSKPKTEG